MQSFAPMVSILVCVARQIGKWNESRMVVGEGPTISIHHYELKAAYVNINQCSMGITLSHLSVQLYPCLILIVPLIFSIM